VYRCPHAARITQTHEVVPGLAYETSSCARCGKVFRFKVVALNPSRGPAWQPCDCPACRHEPSPKEVVESFLSDLWKS
jgi:hypothetical protein